jgi:heptosyltransferase-1
MGDVLHALPAITALRKAHPSWVIGWAIDPHWRPLLTSEVIENKSSERSELRPVVDQVHLVPSKAWGRSPLSRKTWAEIRGLRAELRAGDYDAVLDVQGAIRSAVVARLSGCRRIVGEADPREAPARWLFTEQVRTTGEHVIEQDVDLASAVAGDLLTPMQPTLPVDAQAERWCDELPEIRTWKPVVLIHPGAGWGSKRWPAERYSDVAEEFGRRGAAVLINAGPGEEALAAKVLAGANGQAAVIKSTLPQLIALTRRAALVIGGDTGPVHLASALGKPVVGIYGPTDPKRNGPYGGRFRVLRNPESRRDHTRREQPEAGLLTISPDAVIAAALDLMLAERQGRPMPARQTGPGASAGWGAGWEPVPGSDADSNADSENSLEAGQS